jgi:hypothetical protein
MLDRLKLLLGIDGECFDALLLLLLDKAESFICHYCQISKLPLALNSVCLDLAVLYYNRLGAEGESGRSEGGIRRDFGSLNQDLPRSLLTELNRYTRVISVIEE